MSELNFQIDDLSKQELGDLMVECIKDTKLTAKVLFPGRFERPFSKLHDEMFDMIASGAPKICIAAPRGIGKTSSVGLALTGKNILFRLRKFISYVSNSATSSELQTENLKMELAANQNIRKMFGSVKAKADRDFSETFSRKAWVAFDTLIFPRGSGQQVRGILYRDARPDLIIIDDLENTESVANEELRIKLKQWFFADLMKCVSRYSKDWQVIYIDTLKHEDALLQDLLDSPDWLSTRLELCDDEYHSNAPEFISDEEVRAEADEHRRLGLLDVFYREYRNMPISLEDATFKADKFKYYTEGVELHCEEPRKDEEPKIEKVSSFGLINLVIIDPAKTVKVQSADTAIIGVGVERAGHKIFFRDCVAGKMYPDEILSEAFDMVARMKSFILAVEVTSLHQWISQPIVNEMRVRNVHAQYIELKAIGKKEERIAHLAPYYRLGYIYHNRAVCTKLESQLIGFPRSKLWDVMDAFGYVPKLLDDLAIYFDPDGHEDQDPEDLYKELEDEPAIDYQEVC